ncbi:MAG: Uma2 family endonuclease [Taibaiella sp.]|nr:Uma2 family endonuclease [Taibaiella sp.]
MKLADLDINLVYTYADYLKWTFEQRVELIRGRIFEMSPAPNYSHQRLSTVIQGEIYQFLKGGSCELFSAPFDVRFPRKSKDDKDITTVLQPDLCVVCDKAKLDARGCIGAPDIVVEILSPSNNKKELKDKFEIYEEAGVKEYWVVFPPEKNMLVYTLTNGKYVASPFLYAGDSVVSSVLPGFSLDLTLLFPAQP